MTEYFEGPRKKLDRAKVHIDELDQVLDDFIATKPYRINYKLNADKTFHECRIYHDAKEPPLEIGILVGEIVYQLRSILDHIIFYFSIPKLLQITDREKQIKAAGVPQFPILDEPNEWILNRSLKFVEKPVRDAVERYQPYDRTHCPDPAMHKLSVLSHLNNADKHRVVNVTVGAIRLKPGVELTAGVEVRRGGSTDDGEIIAWVPVHLDPKQHFGPNLTAEILFAHSRDGIIRPISHVAEIYEFVRDEILPCFTEIAAQLDSGAQ